MRRILLFFYISCFSLLLKSQNINYVLNNKTSAIERIFIAGDDRDMNWILDTNGKQYYWINDKYGWGLGHFKQVDGDREVYNTWKYPEKIENDTIFYRSGNIEIKVIRTIINGNLLENYTFTNVGNSSLNLNDIGIYVPFNDNYPDSKTCTSSRVNAHIWDLGYNAAYVNATQMGGKAPHIGLMLKKGAIKGYEILERDRKKGGSNFRGVISLMLDDMILKKGESNTISWLLFTHEGKNDFYKRLIKNGGVYVECDKYVVERGHSVKVTFYGNNLIDNVCLSYDGKIKKMRRKGNKWEIKVRLLNIGENKLELIYDDKKTYAVCHVVSKEREIIKKRAEYIIQNQQMNNHNDPRYGAYMVYDCEDDILFLNDIKTVSSPDRDEGAERLGMGVFLAKQYMLTKDNKIKWSLLRYSSFVRNKLQDEDFNTWSDVTHKGRNRAYNYPWVSNLYFYMYKVTNEKKYLNYGYNTLKAMFRNFGYGFYAIDIPVTLSLSLLKEAGMISEYNILKSDFQKVGEVYLENSINYPRHEVNYEQSIVAPAIIFLSQLYLETREHKYLDEIEKQLNLLDSFAFSQPSYNLNNIAIRHWDGYWFGKKEMWGDVFPHYWSTLSAVAYYHYYLITNDISYKIKAQNIVRNNLCLFFENGEASCAYIYPSKVDGKKGKFYDPFANDQDWALVYYLLVNDGV